MGHRPSADANGAAEDSIRFYALRMHEAGMIKSSPQKIIAENTDWRFLNELKRELKTSCNPDADSWVADFLAWWIDRETGLPIPERAGVLRYFIRVAEKTVWADRPEDLMHQMTRRQDLPPGVDPMRPISVTFIPAKVSDNPALLRVNPEYLTWLLSLPLLERERLLAGNWKIRPAAGLYFKREWCTVVDQVPPALEIVCYWDLAATEKTERNDPDWTVGVELGRDDKGGYWLLDVVRARANPGDVERLEPSDPY